MTIQHKTQSPTAKELLDSVDREIAKDDARRLAELEEISIGYRLGDVVEFGGELPLFVRKMNGFSQPEGTHQWSLGVSSSMELILDQPFQDPVLLAAKFAPFVSPVKKCQSVSLGVNGALVASWDANQEDDYYAIVPATRNPIDRSLHIHLYTPDAAKPSDVFDSQDGRCLGVALCQLSIRNLSEAV